jgi:digeranylgeranylglycerophospholipid reductase
MFLSSERDLLEAQLSGTRLMQDALSFSLRSDRKSGPPSAAFLQRYEKLWRDRLEETLFRNWMIKEKLVTLSDEDFNKLVSVISDYDWEEVSIGEILNAVRSRTRLA